MLRGARKSVKLMAALVELGRVQTAHQPLHHFVTKMDRPHDSPPSVGLCCPTSCIGQVIGWLIDGTGVTPGSP